MKSKNDLQVAAEAIRTNENNFEKEGLRVLRDRIEKQIDGTTGQLRSDRESWYNPILTWIDELLSTPSEVESVPLQKIFSVDEVWKMYSQSKDYGNKSYSQFAKENGWSMIKSTEVESVKEVPVSNFEYKPLESLLFDHDKNNKSNEVPVSNNSKDWADGYLAGLEAAQRISEKEVEGEGWVSVEDRLPELGEEVNVNVSTPNKSYVTSLCRRIRFEGATDYYWDNAYGSSNLHLKQCVTHWQPLPAAPQSPNVNKND
jgi:hypothetical protein